MPRPYNQKTVKDALLLLDIYASNGCSFEEAASGAEVRPSSTGYRVAEHLVDKLADMFPEERLAVVSGEAAGLLREGWRIGDEIPMRGPSATLENVDAILREQYPAHVVEHTANEPAVGFATLVKTRDSNGFDNNAIVAPGDPAYSMVGPAIQPASEVLAEPLDAVEEPTDEMIAGVETGTDAEISGEENPASWDTMETTE